MIHRRAAKLGAGRIRQELQAKGLDEKLKKLEEGSGPADVTAIKTEAEEKKAAEEAKKAAEASEADGKK